MDIPVVGIDCAVDPRNVGLALGRWTGTGLSILELASGRDGVDDTILRWLGGRPAVLAFDAPLGWPTALGTELSAHCAGKPVAAPPNEFFRRDTDRFVKELIGKQPLDVGADRIARTAHAALSLLAAVREGSGQSLPLLWDAESAGSGGALEVYPAATLTAHGLPSSGYKKASDRAVREEIVAGLGTRCDLAVASEPMLENADVLDAAVCLLAAADFLSGSSHSPPDPARAKKEGWIWVRGRL